ncbi:PucR family transcriptional regulator [Nonomuraea zeae]|uniref:PucR family transcriptional regulator n=1 Tax=Nonomuraea zeae TaxID=1642303 RepID=A0A5S4G9C8_9ACTN|nr:PucR family transcriptional regulator [Nonomuraea zeae]TMR29472.1 PucR family transcriptional regulator [Nonomuraea zeae]
MPTVSTLVGRSELGMRLLAHGPARTREIDSALIVQADLSAWGGADPKIFRRTLAIVPFAGFEGRAEDIMRQLSGVDAAGVVLAVGPGGDCLPDVEALAAWAQEHGTPLLLAASEPYRVWAATMEIIREERELTNAHLKEMQREVTRPDGLSHLLRWLARQVEGSVVLLDGAGMPRHAFPVLPEDVIEQAAADIDRVISGAAGAAAADVEAGVVHIQSIGEGGPEATLVVARAQRFPASVRNLIGDASRLLSLSWGVEESGRRRRDVDRAEAQTREAVLHLLLTGQLEAAHRVAETMGPSLAEEVRVYVVECPEQIRDRAVAECDRASHGTAWIVRCPVYARHVIVLAPAHAGGDAMEQALRLYACRSTDIHVGRGGSVLLRDLASGYRQAFHALATARGRAENYAEFSPRGDLAALVRSRGYAWARALLEPLHTYRPDRAGDPDAAALTATIRSWLDFHGGAARQLKIHRNTLPARLRHIERLLGLSLDDLATQAKLHLALCVLDGREGADGEETLDAILDTADVHDWAALQVSSLTSRESTAFLETLRVWLANHARLEPTASALGISAPGVRKRLTRIEEVLGRSLLDSPSARYDLWFALRVFDTCDAPSCE